MWRKIVAYITDTRLGSINPVRLFLTVLHAAWARSLPFHVAKPTGLLFSTYCHLEVFPASLYNFHGAASLHYSVYHISGIHICKICHTAPSLQQPHLHSQLYTPRSLATAIITRPLLLIRPQYVILRHLRIHDSRLRVALNVALSGSQIT